MKAIVLIMNDIVVYWRCEDATPRWSSLLLLVVLAICPSVAIAQKAKKTSESLEEIDPPLARMVVADAKGDFIELRRIRTLDTKTAVELAKSTGGLGLSGLEILDAGVAAALASCPGRLELDGITTLDANAASALARAKVFIRLQGLQSLTSVPLAKKLAVQGSEVSLPRIKKMDRDVADALADCKGPLVLDGLEVLDHKGLARCLSRSEGSQCTFDSLLTLTPEAAAAFENSSRSFHFAKLSQIDAATAAGFSGHSQGLVFVGLEQADPEALEIIFRNKGPTCVGNLPRLAPQGAAIAPAVLKAIAEHEGVLGLAGLTDIDMSLAGALKQHRGDVHLTGVKRLDTGVAESLVGCRGILWLDGLVLGTPDGEAAVKALLKHRGGPRTGFVLNATTIHHLPETLMESCENHVQIYIGNTVGQ